MSYQRTENANSVLLQTDERTFAKILGADKDKVHGDQTLGNTGGNNNKDVAMFDCNVWLD